VKGKFWTVLTVMVIFSLGLAACGPKPTEAPPPPPAEETPTAAPAAPAVEDEWGVVKVAKGDPIKVGFAAGLSGAGIDVLGLDEQRGAELAVKDKPEVMGFAVELQVEDAMCSAEGGQTVATKFVADPQIVAVLGHMCSSSCLPASKVYEQNHYSMVSPSCTAPALTMPVLDATEIFNRTCWSDVIQGPAAGKFVYETLGVSKVATIHDGSPYAEQLGQEFTKGFEALGGEIVAAEAVNVGDTDMRPVLTRIKAGEPGLLYWSGFVAEGGYLAAQMPDVGMEDVLFMGADGIKADEFIKAAGDRAEGVYASAGDLAEAGPALPKFLEAYEAEYGEAPIAPFHAHAYDAYMVIVNAIEQVGQVDADGNLLIGRKALRDAIRATKDHQGLSGKIACDENGDCGTGSVAFSMVTGGEWVAAGAPAAPPAEGKTFIFGRGGDSVQLDPAVVTDGESFRVTGQILEPLFQYEDGGTGPIPALATGWEVSDDNLTWTITLREGVKFHDGTDFNADAVVLNYERQWKTDHPLHFETQVYEYWEYMFNGFDEDCLITGVEAVDDLTVKITLREPLAPLLANLAMDIFAISSPAALEEYGADYGMPTVGAVGTGPFKFVEWVEDDHITVEANEDYWAGRPTIDRVIWRVIPDDSARFLALKAGDIHALQQANVEDLKDAEADPNLYVEAIGLNTGYLAFNYHIKELQDPKVREAVFHAIDRQALKDAFYGDYGQVASTFLHPSMWGRPDIEDWAYDPDLAMELLAEAGFPDGLTEVTNEDTGEVGPLKFYYMPVTRFYYPSPKEIGEAMAADLAKVGIETELYLEGDWPAFLGSRREGKLYGLYMLGWGGDNGDPDNFLNFFFGGLSGTGQVKEPDQREGWYANQEVADLLFQAATEPEQAKRAPLYEEVERLLHEDRARLWVIHNDTPWILSSKISGFVVQPVGACKYEGVVIAD